MPLVTNYAAHTIDKRTPTLYFQSVILQHDCYYTFHLTCCVEMSNATVRAVLIHKGYTCYRSHRLHLINPLLLTPGHMIVSHMLQ